MLEYGARHHPGGVGFGQYRSSRPERAERLERDSNGVVGDAGDAAARGAGMIENPTVTFTNGKSVDAERVKFKDGGFVAVRASDGWAYYPREQIGRIVSRDE